MGDKYQTLDYSYPVSFLCGGDKFYMRLPLLSATDLLNCVLRFKSIPRGEQMKADCVNFIKKDFAQQTSKLTQLSTSELLRYVSPSTGHSTLCFPMVCQFIHNRYGIVVASQLLSSRVRWNPPEVAKDGSCPQGEADPIHCFLLRETFFQIPDL